MQILTSLNAAKNTCAYVNRALSLGAANSFLRRNAPWVTDAEKELRTARKVYPKQYANGKNLKLSFSIFPQIEKYSKAVKTGCCGEFAVVAFQHLRNIYLWGDKPDSLEMLRAKGHWVVVLDRKSETNISNPKTWNKDAVVCDAWYDVAKTIEYYLLFKSDFEPIESLRLPDDPDKFLLVPPDWESW